jgi:NADH-quinone oxidoreductase subunit L
MLVGAAALAGFPLLSGFFSKDEILAGVLAGRPVFGIPVVNTVLYGLAALTAFMTAFYTFRLIFLAFEGEPRGEHHPHPNPSVLTTPLAVLAALTLGGALLGLPLIHFKPLDHWLEPILGHGSPASGAGHLSDGAEILLLVASGAISIAGILLARRLYKDGTAREEAIAARVKTAYAWLSNKWYVDELYDAVLVKPLRALGALSAVFDAVVIDGLVNGVAAISRRTSVGLRALATGQVQSYSLWFGAGAVAVAAAFAWLRA